MRWFWRAFRLFLFIKERCVHRHVRFDLHSDHSEYKYLQCDNSWCKYISSLFALRIFQRKIGKEKNIIWQKQHQKMSVKMRVNSYFYTGDHLCSTSVVLDIDGNISQSVTCVPYGEISLQISINFPTFASWKTKKG